MMKGPTGFRARGDFDRSPSEGSSSVCSDMFDVVKIITGCVCVLYRALTVD
jgi:hypothetical protein